MSRSLTCRVHRVQGATASIVEGLHSQARTLRLPFLFWILEFLVESLLYLYVQKRLLTSCAAAAGTVISLAMGRVGCVQELKGQLDTEGGGRRGGDKRMGRRGEG